MRGLALNGKRDSAAYRADLQYQRISENQERSLPVISALELMEEGQANLEVVQLGGGGVFEDHFDSARDLRNRLRKGIRRKVMDSVMDSVDAYQLHSKTNAQKKL